MKPFREASVPAGVVQPAALPPIPSEDQPFFDESLRASARSLRKLVQRRCKADR